MKVSPTKNLRLRMELFEYSQDYIAKKIGYSTGYVSQRFLGKKEWGMEAAEGVMKLLKIPPEEFLDYFGTQETELKLKTCENEVP